VPPAPSEPPEPINPYKILQVDPEAEDEVIQAAYRRLAQKYHPDRSQGPEAAARMVGINAAWETIKDPVRRAAYDRLRDEAAARRAEQPAAAQPAAAQRPAPSGETSRASHETARTSPPAASPRAPETVSPSWTSGRSTTGSGYDAATMRTRDGFGAAGQPPGNPSGSVLNFGRYSGWSLGEIARRDLDYVEWLDRMPIGRPYRDEIDPILRTAGRRRSATAETERRGLFRRR
jgi:curved DNA-binding protein CbpA